MREVFDQFGDNVDFMIELKKSKTNRGIEEKLVDLLKEYKIVSTCDKDKKPKVVVHSFYEKMLKQVHELNEDIPLLKLITFENGETAELSEEEIDDLLTYSSAIGVGHKLLDPDFIRKINEKALLVYAADVQDEKDAQDMEEIGAEGIFTD